MSFVSKFIGKWRGGVHGTPRPVAPTPPQTMPDPNMSGGTDPVANNKTFEGTP